MKVVNASKQFLHGTTTIPTDKMDPLSRSTVTKMLCMTCNPEEKRKIIGDTFVEASLIIYSNLLTSVFDT